jgi:hypothetical protein
LFLRFFSREFTTCPFSFLSAPHRFRDAPALSTDASGGLLASGVAGLGLGGDGDRPAAMDLNDEQWDDAAVVSAPPASSGRKPASAISSSSGDAAVVGSASSSSAGVLDYKSLAPKRGAGSDNIAEKLRLEETKAQLAAAREGMEREAQKLKEEKERKAQVAAAKAAGAGTGGMGGGGMGGSSIGSRWLPPHLRAGGAGTSSASAGVGRFGAAAAMGGKIDVQSEELFPDLASADKILEQQKEREHQAAIRIPKKTPVGGGATWASKPRQPANAAAPASSARHPAPQSTPSEPAQPDSPDPEPQPEPDESEPPPVVTAAAATDSAAAAAPKSPPKIAAKKKNKKDLSTFKPGG